MTFSILFCCERKWTKNNSVFNWYKNYKNRLRLATVIVKNILPRFLWFTVYISRQQLQNWRQLILSIRDFFLHLFSFHMAFQWKHTEYTWDQNNHYSLIMNVTILILALESRHKGSKAPSSTSQAVNEDRMRMRPGHRLESVAVCFFQCIKTCGWVTERTFSL